MCAMKITWFGHSAFRLDFADKVVLIDPFFTGNPAYDGDRDKSVEGATHILITHGHGDHDRGWGRCAARVPERHRSQSAGRADGVPYGRYRHFRGHGVDQRTLC